MAGLTVLVNWAVLPLARKWSQVGRQLEPRLRVFEELKRRAEEPERLLASRERLVRQMGSLVSRSQPQEGAEGKEGADPGKGSKPSPPALAAQVEKSFKECGAKIKVVTARKVPRRSAPLNHFKMVGLSVQAEGNVDAIVKTLHALEKGPRFMRVEELKIHHDVKKPGVLSVTLDIVAYEPADEA